jgi:hypothetical protein
VSRAARLATWLALGALLVLAAAVRRDAHDDGARHASLARRLAGPFASLAASVQWTRADLAWRAGREDQGLARAEAALELDPASAEGWIFLAHHMVFDLGAVGRGTAGERAAWIEAGVALLQRGEEVADDPAALAFDLGLVAVYLASLEPDDRAWPPDEQRAWSLARSAFTRAADAGHALAAEALEHLPR